MNYRSPFRHFILGPAIIVMAFTLHSWTMTVIQVIAGIVYIGIGVLKLTDTQGKDDA